MLNEHGAIETAKRLIGKSEGLEGLLRLKEISDNVTDCLKWSIEQSVISNRELFETYYDPNLVKRAQEILQWAYSTPIEEMGKSVKSHW